MRLRAAPVIPLFLIAGSVRAQFVGGPITGGMNALKNQGSPDLSQGSPTQPSGFPLPPVKREDDLPQEGPIGEDQGQFHLINGEKMSRSGTVVHLTGNVEFTDRGYHCWADEATGDTSTNVF